MRSKLNIEELFASGLKNVEYEPSPSVWTKTARTVRRRQFFRFNAGRFNVYYAAGILLLGAALTYLVAAAGETQKKNDGLQEEVKLDTPIQDLPETQQQNSKTDKESVITSSRDEEQDRAADRETTHIAGKVSDEQLQEKQPKQVTPQPSTTLPESGSAGTSPVTVATLVPFFIPSVNEGCAPLTVEFINASINASSLTWNFGIPAEGYDPDKPGVTFTTPGTYRIILSAMNPEGLEKSYSTTITVHPVPEALFEVDRGSLYNYSVDASKFSWYVLPEQKMTGMEQVAPFSSEFQPSLDKAIETGRSLYENKLYLHLLAENEFGCRDTVAAPLPESAPPELVFPTAFSPNPNGSIGGYYNPIDPDNQVFHPNFNEEPETYHLRIFNKAGTLVFETNNIYIGWDGYYQEAPAPRGVYIYQCTGIWKNGNPFQYRGDLTILWSEQ